MRVHPVTLPRNPQRITLPSGTQACRTCGCRNPQTGHRCPPLF